MFIYVFQCDQGINVTYGKGKSQGGPIRMDAFRKGLQRHAAKLEGTCAYGRAAMRLSEMGVPHQICERVVCEWVVECSERG